MSLLILRTINGAMLQDTVAGRIYTSRSPHLTEMNSFVESFVNSQVSGVQGEKSRRRPAALKILVSSDECSNLNEGVKPRDLQEAWDAHIAGIRKAAETKSAGNKAVDALTDDDWASFCKDWVKENSGSKKKAKAEPEEGGEAGSDNGGEDGGAPRPGGRNNLRRNQ